MARASKIAPKDFRSQASEEEPAIEFDQQLMLLTDAASALVASLHAADVLRTVVELAQRFGAADAYAVWRKHASEDVWSLVSSAGLSQAYVEGGASFVSSSGPPEHPMIIQEVSAEPYLAARHEALKREGICSMLVIPLVVRGRASGTMVFYWKTPHRFTDFEVRIASALGNMAASALGSAELYERECELRDEAELSQQRSALLAEAGAVLAGSLDYDTTLRSVAKLAVPRFADWCAVDVLRDGALERVTLEHMDSAKLRLADEYRKKYPPHEDDVSNIAFRTGQPVIVPYIPDELLAERIPDREQLEMLRTMGIQALIIAPMVNRGRPLGLLTFVSSKPKRQYTAADLSLAQEIARRAAMAIDNARLYADVRASEERYRSLVSATTAIVWTANPAGEFIERQASWEAFTGQRWEEHRGFGWQGALHPDDVEFIRAAWRSAQQEERTYEAEGRLWHAQTARYRYFIVRATPVRNGAGVSEWIGTVTDIHDRKQAEEERKALLAREQEALYTAQLLNRVGQILSAELDPKALTQSVTDIATQLVNAEFGALFFNQVNEKGDSYTLYTLSGAPYEAFANFPLPRNTSLFGATFRGEGAVRIEDVKKDPRYGKNAPYYGMPQGHLPVSSYLAVPVISRSGHVMGGLFFGHSQPGVFQEQAEAFAIGIASQAAIALDNARLFAESQQAQEALQRSNEELRLANEDLNHFAYSASHDLQEPLRMISAYTQLLQRRYQDKLDDEADRYIKFAVEGAHRLEALLRDILAYTQAANTAGEKMEPLDANVVLEKVLSNLHGAIERSGARVTSGRLPVVKVAEIHLVQVLQNLIGNAIKYAGQAAPRVEIEASRAQGAWVFSVRDNGIGIDPKYSELVFGLFKRLHTADQYGGTGIGLAICQKIVKRYGGRIWVDSVPEQGATFYFTLPDCDAA